MKQGRGMGVLGEGVGLYFKEGGSKEASPRK